MTPAVDRSSPLRSIARQVVIWLPVATMVWAITVRSGVVDGFFSRALTDCGGCLRPLVFKHDLPLLALLVMAQIAGIACRSRPLSIALRLLACGVLLVYFVEMVIFDLFTHRLNLLDVTGYGPEGRAIKAIFGEYIQRRESISVAIVLLGLLVCAALAFVRVRPMQPTRAVIVGLMMLFVGCACFIPDSAAFVYAWSYRNVVEAQKANTAGNAYSDDFIRKTIASRGATWGNSRSWQAPADDALYQRVTRWVSEQLSDRPLFALVNTMSTHQPFSNPRTGETTEEAAFRYGDQAFGAFVKQLRDAGFFENGVLFLTGDHSMTPVTAAEVARFGDAAPRRTPLRAIGAGIAPHVAVGAYQQADLPPSIEYLVAPTACFASRQRVLFSDRTKPQLDERCIVYSRGDEMDAVDVFCGERRGRVRLDGDATAAVSSYVPSSVLADINRERVAWFERQGADGVVTRFVAAAGDAMTRRLGACKSLKSPSPPGDRRPRPEWLGSGGRA